MCDCNQGRLACNGQCKDPIPLLAPKGLVHGVDQFTSEYIRGHNAAIDKMLGKSEKE